MNLRKFILDALRKKFEGVDEKVLNRIARNAAKTVKSEDEATQFVEDYTIQQVIDSYSDSRVTESISSYEKKHGLKDGKPVTTDDEPDDVDGDKDPDKGKKGNKDNDPDEDGEGKGKKGNKEEVMPAWAKALIDGQTRLNERLDGIEKGKQADARKSKFLEVIKDAPDKFRERAEKAYNRCTFKDDEDFENYIEDLAEEVEEAKGETETKGGIVTPPKGGNKGGKEYTPSDAMKARAERNKTQVTQSVIQGLPTAGK